MDQDFLDNVKQIFNLLEISYTIFSDKEHIYIDNQDFYNHKIDLASRRKLQSGRFRINHCDFVTGSVTDR